MQFLVRIMGAERPARADLEVIVQGPWVIHIQNVGVWAPLIAKDWVANSVACSQKVRETYLVR